jgi:hypothetical protein
VFFTTTEEELVYLSPKLFELEEVKSEELRVKSEKFLKDGQLYIRVGEKVYDIQGRLVY